MSAFTPTAPFTHTYLMVRDGVVFATMPDRAPGRSEEAFRFRRLDFQVLRVPAPEAEGVLGKAWPPIAREGGAS